MNPPPFSFPQPVINAPRGDINFVCPGSGYIGGLFSTYNFSASDRIWQPYCCVRSYSSLVNCAGPPATWSNLLGMNLNYSAGDPYVITGLYSFYSNLDLLVCFCLIAKLECLKHRVSFPPLRDRRWRFRICQIQGLRSKPTTRPFGCEYIFRT